MLDISKRFIDISETTRPGDKIDKIFKTILYHAPLKNEGAIKNRNYINNLKNQDDIFCSYHYIIDFNGKIINIIPEDEISLHTNILNVDMHSISICICYNNSTKISTASITSLRKLALYLTKKYSLVPSSDLIRCYDIINKRSPIFFVDTPYYFMDFKDDLKNRE